MNAAITAPRILITDDSLNEKIYKIESENEEDEEDEDTIRRNRILQRRQIALQNTLRFD